MSSVQHQFNSITMVTRNTSRRQATKEKKYGAEPRTTYKIEVRFNSDPSIKSISPVTKWGDSTEIALELLCPGTQEQGYRFFSPTIYQQKCYNYCRKQVHMKHKCDDCERLGIIVVRWSGPDVIARESWSALGEIHISGFEPVDGLHMLKFVDPFKAETNWGTSKEFRIALNGPTQVEVTLPPIGSKKTATVEERTISVGELEGVEVRYTRQ